MEEQEEVEEEITADATPSLARIMSKEAGCAAPVVCLRRGTAGKGRGRGRQGDGVEE